MKILYDTLENKTKPYPRSDDNPVIGLDPRYVICNLIEEPQPTYNSSTEMLKRAGDVINLDTFTVVRSWDIINIPEETILENRIEIYPNAEMYMIHLWMVENGITDPDSFIIQIFNSFYTDELDKTKAIIRWKKVSIVPRDHPLVNIVGSYMQPPMSPEDIDIAWPNILNPQ